MQKDHEIIKSNKPSENISFEGLSSSPQLKSKAIQISEKLYDDIIDSLLQASAARKMNSKEVFNSMKELLEGAKSGHFLYLNIFARVLKKISSDTAIDILEKLKDEFDKDILNDLVVILVQIIAKSKIGTNNLTQVDVGRKAEGSTEECVKWLLKLSMFKDKSTEEFIAKLLENHFINIRQILLHDFICDNFILNSEEGKKHDKNYYEFHYQDVSDNALKKLTKRANDYQEMVGRKANIGDTMTMPAAITQTCTAIFQSVVKMNKDTKQSNQSGTIEHVVQLKDGETRKITIPGSAIHLFFMFLNMVELTTAITISQQRFKEDIQTGKKNKIKAHFFSNHKLESSLSSLLYNTNFLMEPIVDFVKLLEAKNKTTPIEYIDSEWIRQELNKTIINELETLVNSKTNDPEEKLLKHKLLEVLKKYHTTKSLQKIHRAMMLLINEFETNRIAKRIKAELTNSKFKSLIMQIPGLKLEDNDIAAIIRVLANNNYDELNKLSNAEFGKSLKTFLEEFSLGKLFTLTTFQKNLSKFLATLTPDPLLIWFAKKEINNPLFMPDLLPKQIEGLSIQPAQNLIDNLKSMLNLPKVQKLPNNVKLGLTHSLTHSGSQYCETLKDFFKKPNIVLSLDILAGKLDKLDETPLIHKLKKKLAKHRKLWHEFQNYLLQLSSSDNVTKMFGDLWSKPVFKTIFEKTANNKIHYKKYKPLITLALFYCYYNKITPYFDILKNKSELYIHTALEYPTFIAANQLNTITQTVYEVNPKDNASKKFKHMTFNLGLNAKIKGYHDSKAEAKEYRHVLQEVCFNLVGLNQIFDPDDDYFKFLMQYCSGSETEKNSLTQFDSSQMKVKRSHIKWQKDIYKKIKDILLSQKQVDDSQTNSLILSLAINADDEKTISELLKAESRFEVIYINNADPYIKSALDYVIQTEQLKATLALLEFCVRHLSIANDSGQILLQHEIKETVCYALNHLNPTSAKFILEIKPLAVEFYIQANEPVPLIFSDSRLRRTASGGAKKGSNSNSSSDYSNSSTEVANITLGIIPTPKELLTNILEGAVDIHKIENLLGDQKLNPLQIISWLQYFLKSMREGVYAYNENIFFAVIKRIGQLTATLPTAATIFQTLQNDVRTTITLSYHSQEERTALLAELNLNPTKSSESNSIEQTWETSLGK